MAPQVQKVHFIGPEIQAQMLCPLMAYIANTMDPDQTAPKEQSDQGS